MRKNHASGGQGLRPWDRIRASGGRGRTRTPALRKPGAAADLSSSRTKGNPTAHTGSRSFGRAALHLTGV